LLEHFVDDRLARGRAYFSRDDARNSLAVSPTALQQAVGRLMKKRRLANPRHGFYLILREEDRLAGAPDPVRWIHPLMKHQGIDYRVSLLRAAAVHGSSHQAAMVFQVIVPKQLRGLEIGRHRLEFLYQSPRAFKQVNQSGYLQQAKTDTGYARVAGVELTLLDCARYFHKAGGINAVAQISKDIGAKAAPRLLAKLATSYENSSVRRLGYLLDLVGHARQAKALLPFVASAKSVVALDPSIRSLGNAAGDRGLRDAKWMVRIDEAVELDD